MSASGITEAPYNVASVVEPVGIGECSAGNFNGGKRIGKCQGTPRHTEDKAPQGAVQQQIMSHQFLLLPEIGTRRKQSMYHKRHTGVMNLSVTVGKYQLQIRRSSVLPIEVVLPYLLSAQAVRQANRPTLAYPTDGMPKTD
jgi:hypothetical protein